MTIFLRSYQDGKRESTNINIFKISIDLMTIFL